MMFMDEPVHYLENSDFDKDGNLINPDIPKNLPVVIMLQANFCGYCTSAKSAFEEFAKENTDRVFAATIQGDGNVRDEAPLGKRLNTIKKKFRGFPDYVLYINGKRVEKEIGGRSKVDLEKFTFN